MNKAGWLLFALSWAGFGLMTVTAPEQNPASHTVEKIDGDSRTVEQLDEQGRMHGRQEWWYKGKLVQVRIVEHGQVIEDTEYRDDGSIKDKWVEGDDYTLHRTR